MGNKELRVMIMVICQCVIICMPCIAGAHGLGYSMLVGSQGFEMPVFGQVASESAALSHPQSASEWNGSFNRGSADDMRVSTVPHGPISIASDSDFAAQGWPGLGTVDQPYVIEGLEITPPSDGCAVTISDTAVHFVIKSCIISSTAAYGIKMNRVSHGRIEDCVVAKKSTGIGILDSSDCAVARSIVTDCSTYGIYIKSSLGCEVLNAVCSRKVEGVYVRSSHECMILNNTLCDNHYDGVWLEGALDTTVANNTIFATNWYGIYVAWSDNSTVTNNTVYANGWGIAADLTDDSSFYYNTVGWNGQENALEVSQSGHTWDDGIGRGNRWSDYGGLGVYVIGGDSQSVDRYPTTLTDSTPPTINSPPDFSLQSQQSGYVIRWSPRDQYPSRYQLTIDEESYKEAVWFGADIGLALDELPTYWQAIVYEPGVHNITVAVFDCSGGFVVDTVFASVNGEGTTTSTTTAETTASSTTTTMDNNTTAEPGPLQGIETSIIVASASVIAFVIVLVAVKRTR